MTLNEFIEKLQKLQKEGKGDYAVVVQYRDEGGDLPGFEDETDPLARDNRKQILL